MAGRTFSFEVNRTSSAPAATLFRLATDGGRWADWAKPLILQSSWEQQGDPAPAGIGAVRKVGCWPILMREKTVEYEQDRRHVYELIGPRTPAKGYRAEATFTPERGGGHRYPLGWLVHRRAARDRPHHARHHGRLDPADLGPACQSRGA